jgi:DNA-binding Xre family transcriptional regulator
MKAINITAYTEDASQIEAIKAVIKAFKIKYKILKMTHKRLTTRFVAMIRKGEQELKEGKGISVTLQELEDLCK